MCYKIFHQSRKHPPEGPAGDEEVPQGVICVKKFHGYSPQLLLAAIVLSLLLLAGCRSTADVSSSKPGGSSTTTLPRVPPGVISSVDACRGVVDASRPGFFTGAEAVHVVLTTLEKAMQIGGDSPGQDQDRLVWLVEVHAKAVNWNHSVPAHYHQSGPPPTDFSAILDARTGRGLGRGECDCWPQPLGTIGEVIVFPPDC